MIKQDEFGGHWDDHLLCKRFPLHLESTRQQFFRNATCVIVNTSILDISFAAAGQVEQKGRRSSNSAKRQTIGARYSGANGKQTQDQQNPMKKLHPPDHDYACVSPALVSHRAGA
jgi:hypothetical protein